MIPDVMVLTLSRAHIGALNDALYTLLNDPESEPEDLAGYQTLCDDIAQQLTENERAATANQEAPMPT